MGEAGDGEGEAAEEAVAAHAFRRVLGATGRHAAGADAGDGRARVGLIERHGAEVAARQELIDGGAREIERRRQQGEPEGGDEAFPSAGHSEPHCGQRMSVTSRGL